MPQNLEEIKGFLKNLHFLEGIFDALKNVLLMKLWGFFVKTYAQICQITC